MREIACGASNAFEQTFAVRTEPTCADEPAVSISSVTDGPGPVSARMFPHSGCEVGKSRSLPSMSYLLSGLSEECLE